MQQRSRIYAAALIVVGLTIAATCALTFPAVEGLGTKVRLPVFHGAMTWVNLAAFSVMGLLGVLYLVTRREAVYRWETAVRWIAVPVWLTGSVLGLLAALNTWDFTGSKASPMTVAAADPRLAAQGWILLAALALVALELVLDSQRLRSIADIGFVAFLWIVLLRAVLGPGRALHPDSPVLNSDEIGIKLLFFGIVIGLGMAFS
ncbi:MAG: hypothetical protein FDZ75_05450, partial [Actinobacteria bacterium]